jgi:Domain of unknown function (DUF5655)/Domain of unknown function (DUF4287)
MAKRSRYGVHPGVQMIQDWIATLKEKTGRSLDEWIAHIQKDGPPTEKERREWLKKKYDLGTNSGGYLAQRASGSETGMREDTPDAYLQAAERYVDEQYAGKKTGLRPIFEKLLDLGLALGKDVKACPCQTIVPLYRKHVIAQIKPTTNTRIDFGLALAKVPDTKIPKRLIDTGGKAKKDRITHRIPITNVKEIDGFISKWLQKAYELDAT